MKQRVAERVDRWRQDLLEKYRPIGELESLNLSGCTVTLREYEMPAIRIGLKGLGRMSGYQVSRPAHPEETYCLIVKHPVVWDAETLENMIIWRNEFAIIDRNGVCLKTSIFLPMLTCSFGKYATQIEDSDGHIYFVDSYRGICSIEGGKPRRAIEYAPFVESLRMRPTVVVRDQSGPRWYAVEWGVQSLQMVDARGQCVLNLGRIRMWQRFAAAIIGLRGPGRLQVRFESIAPEIPKELALFMAASTIM